MMPEIPPLGDPQHYPNEMPTLRESELISKIENAFRDVVLGNGDSLNMTEYYDSGGCAPHFKERAANDERYDWTRIADSDIEIFQVVFCFTNLEGFRFYIPAYMIWSIRNPDSDCFSADATIYALNPYSHQFSETSMIEFFSKSQIDAMLSFLDFWAAHPNFADADARQNASAIRAHRSEIKKHGG